MPEVIINNGQGIINLLFDNFASCLVIKRPLVINWPDCAGSVGEYFAISDYDVDDRNQYTRAVNAAMSEGTDEDQIEAAKLLLHLFTNGTYQIHKYIANVNEQEILMEAKTIYADHVPHDEQFFGDYFPSYGSQYFPLQFTIRNSRINPERVEYYVRLIRAGKRPTIITYQVDGTFSGNYSHDYIIDGHHKVLAYLKLKENIPIVGITRTADRSDTTAAILLHARTFLKPHEYRHLFENNDDNIVIIDFPSNETLTADLDDLLKNTSRLELAIIRLLKKYAGLPDHRKWLDDRLHCLKKNKHIHLSKFGNGLGVLEWQEHKQYGPTWFGIRLHTPGELTKWIEGTILAG